MDSSSGSKPKDCLLAESGTCGKLKKTDADNNLTATSDKPDIEKLPKDDQNPHIWSNLTDAKSIYIGLAMWCTGWNLSAMILLNSIWYNFLPIGILGTCFAASAYHCKLVQTKKRYKHLAAVMLFAGFYVAISMVLLNDVAHDFAQLVTKTINRRVDHERKTTLKVMLGGNIVLLLFAIYCNGALLKAVGEGFGKAIDECNDKRKEDREAEKARKQTIQTNNGTSLADLPMHPNWL
uniref:Transmembrane protein n=1 Tax=Panagrellus redivivus TaxID=6233 RepID=A0A7E4UTK0_PANRE